MYKTKNNITPSRTMPKTRSGKILRRVLRNYLVDKKLKNIGDLSTMLNKNIIKELRLIN